MEYFICYDQLEDGLLSHRGRWFHNAFVFFSMKIIQKTYDRVLAPPIVFAGRKVPPDANYRRHLFPGCLGSVRQNFDSLPSLLIWTKAKQLWEGGSVMIRVSFFCAQIDKFEIVSLHDFPFQAKKFQWQHHFRQSFMLTLKIFLNDGFPSSLLNYVRHSGWLRKTIPKFRRSIKLWMEVSRNKHGRATIKGGTFTS